MTWLSRKNSPQYEMNGHFLDFMTIKAIETKRMIMAKIVVGGSNRLWDTGMSWESDNLYGIGYRRRET